MNILPLTVLKGSKKNFVLVELKNGDSVKGILENTDNFMNMSLKDVVYTSNQNFWKSPEIYVRGNFINSIQLQENLLDKFEEVKEVPMVSQISPIISQSNKFNSNSQRGGRGRGDRNERGRGGRGRGPPTRGSRNK